MASNAPGSHTPPSYLPIFSPARARAYVRSIPFFTRICLIVLVATLVLLYQYVIPWDIVAWGSLKPSAINLGTMHRLNTYPFINGSFLHALLNILSIIPLLERFEAEHGTLVSIAMFMGPFATFPAILYIITERFIFRGDTEIYGTSVWVFLLLSAEAIKIYKADPYFTLGPYKISTWVSPLVLAVLIWIFIPGTSIIGHIYGCLIGYAWGLGYLKALAPPEKILRWAESKLNLLGRLPRYVSVDQKTYGRYGVLPSTSSGSPSTGGGASAAGVPLREWTGGSGRLGP